MKRQRRLSMFLGQTPCGAMMSAFCALLVLLLAACGGTTGNTTSGGSTLSGGTDISGKTILFEIKSGASNSFFVPVGNGARPAAALTGLKLQIQYGNDDDATIVSQMNTAIASNV